MKGTYKTSFAALLLSGVAIAQTNADSQTFPKASSVPMQAIEKLVQNLDREFQTGNGSSYTKLFRPDHVGALAMLGRHIQRLCSLTGTKRTRSSQIVAGPMQFPGRTVVRLQHVIEWPLRGSQKASKHRKQNRLVEHSYLAVRLGENGKAVPTFAIEMPPNMDCVAERKFKCPPCNYEIGGVDGFLCVPMRREQALALEAASFYLIGTDVVCDISVLIPAKTKATTAKASALKLARAFAKIEPSAKVGVATHWLPPMHEQSPPLGMDSARVVVDLPKDQAAAGGTRTIFHVVQFGGLQHILLVRSTVASLHEHEDAINSLFMSYMLLEVDCEEAELATRPLRHHTGGSIKGTTYTNHKYNVELTAPKGWHAEHRVGGSMFRVHWKGPNGSQMWFVGHRVPAGMDAWTTKLADRWLSHHCQRNQLEPDAKHAGKPEARWQQGPDKSWRRTCTLTGTTKTARKPGSPARRIMHVQVHEDLLLIVDGFGTTEADEQALRQALQTLKRQ